MIFGIVDIDQSLGPTETLLIADGITNPAYATVELLAQADVIRASAERIS
ncbi:MAG: histidinol dehydrogenase [Gemmatimonadota bacterium]|nr:histidinol dehydrogenase [Gemmatimonadota bacterium]